MSGVSEAVKRVLLGVELKANVVYNIPRLSCLKSYIGQTARTRVREHKAAVKKGETDTSAVAEHV